MGEFISRPCPTACPWLNSPDCVACTEAERFVRHYVHGPATSKMSENEREFCVGEADHCGEGMFSADELRAMSDQELAKSVMTAWAAYVSSNCM